jgi:2-oxoglutarate ferredoxin oxidoreductase subunit gamma
MLERILIAGFGGQGIISMGKFLAAVAVDHVPHVTFFPSYGIEVRGGTSNCQVVLASEEIASPVPDRVDSLIVMNQQSLDRFAERLVEGGLLVVDSTLCTAEARPDAVTVPATELANGMGDTRVANTFLIGVYLTRRPLLPVAAVEREMERVLRGKGEHLLALNRRALHAGLEAGAPRRGARGGG